MSMQTSQHRGAYALEFLRAPDLSARLDIAIENDVIVDILESAKHLAGLITPSENASYWIKKYEIQPSDMSLIKELTKVDEDKLSNKGQKTLMTLIKALLDPALTAAAKNFNGAPPIKIEQSSLYHGLDQSKAHLTPGEPEEFGIYPREQRHRSVITEYVTANADCFKAVAMGGYVRKFPDLKRPINSYDMQGLSLDAVSGDYTMFKDKALKTVMSLPNTFSEVSRKDFSISYLKAAEQPRALAAFALVALGSVSMSTPDEYEKQRFMALLKGKIWGHKGEFLISAKEFTVNEFASNPLTVDEIKALPFLLGQHQAVYAEVEHNHAVHAEACVTKLRTAGYDFAADCIIENQVQKVVKPTRERDDEPSFGM